MTSRQSLEELRPIWDVIKEMKGAELANIPVMLVGEFDYMKSHVNIFLFFDIQNPGTYFFGIVDVS